MNRHNFINGPMPKREYPYRNQLRGCMEEFITGYHQCLFNGGFDIDSITTSTTRCQTMLSADSPLYCPDHN